MRHLPNVVLGTAALLLATAARAQVVVGQMPPQMRFVDFHARLDEPGVVVAIGRLGKWKEGRRERLADGKLGGGTTVSVVSGTQFFQVPVTATLAPQLVFGAGKDDDATQKGVRVAFDLQLARLPDGGEQRQSLTGTGARLEPDALALFVLVPADKGKRKKGLELLHVVPFDRQLDPGPDGEATFVDAMRDFYVVNRRMADLEQALAAVDACGDDAEHAEPKQKALAHLKDLVEHPPELRIGQNDALLAQHAGPLQARAQKRLADAARAEPAPADGKH